MNSKKIMFYIASLAKGGAQRVILNLTESLVSKGHQVTIVTTGMVENEYELPTGAKRILSDIQDSEITSNRILNLKNRFMKLRSIWQKENPDVIISFIGKNNFMAILTAWGLNIPVVTSVRGEPTEEYYSKMTRFLAKTLMEALLCAKVNAPMFFTLYCAQTFFINIFTAVVAMPLDQYSNSKCRN